MIEMDAEQHAKYASKSQFMTHLVGRVLKEQKLEATPIDTAGFGNLCKITELTTADSFDLFYALYKHTPSANEQIAKLRVPVIRIGTVKHQLKFDKTEFTVEAGKEIEIIFENSDTLPHNLLLAHPGALEEVGALADKMALQPDGMSKHFIPDSPKVLKSTKLLQEGKSETLKIKAPETKGDYLYICTFPGHWRTMYGKMILK